MKTGQNTVQKGEYAMNERDKNRDIQLERLFLESRASLPEFEPDPDLPAHIRALAATRPANEDRPARASRRGWAWVSLAGATVAASILTGGYVGYRLWTMTQEPTVQQITDSDAIGAALSQSGFADDLANGEVQE
ncbi:MAG TPA: hypothetical protein VJS69_13995 [Candidatus Krumholzibacteria bacterium]|nr:hypothetical protein [Candidatus Krumholzibacteria bacterium]